MSEGLNVISLFDGMRCGYHALDMSNIKVNKYYSSEIDKYAQIVGDACFHDVIKLGDVRNIDTSKLDNIDLLIGGSPCQSFSFAGKRKGMVTKCDIEITSLDQYLDLKNSDFEFEGQSYLFWEFVRILEEVKPKYFLLENVMMIEKWEHLITKTLGVKPIMINSALLTAQNRKRLYWSNIGMVKQGLWGDLACGIEQPKDRGILLKDILENEVDSKYYLSDKAIEGILKHKELQKEKGYGFGAVIKNEDEKMNSLKVGGKGVDDLICVSSRGRNPQNPKSRKSGLNTEQHLEPRLDGKTNCLTSVQKDNLVMQINPSKESGGKQPYQQNRVYDANGQAPALCRDKADLLNVHNMMPRSSKNGNGGTGHLTRSDGKTYCLDTGNTNAVEYSQIIRRLTPKECLRLQGFTEEKTQIIINSGVSDSQLYKMIGNGWTIPAISHIFNYIKPWK